MLKFLRLTRLPVLFVALCFLSEHVALAIPTPDAATAKHEIVKRGPGQHVKVKEASGSEVQGKIVTVGPTVFSIQSGNDPAVEIAYADVSAVDGTGIAKHLKLGLIAGGGVLILVIALAVA